MLMNTSSDFLVPSIDEKLCAYQKDRISQMIRDYLEINQQIKNETINKSFDLDGYYGAQCWDFAC